MDHILNPDFSDYKTLEKYSSTFTLSDMEIFIFPELFYPLVLANIMSPILWEWRKNPWFHEIEKKSFTYKANRIKQFIIENYVFNLDLSTWGLTTKTSEINRFREFFDMDLLRKSNALFGYEGDKYYFDIDIRKHFGLDKFDSEIIPYWKTETLEAMTAFRFKENFSTGAGECVSLSSLYAAAMFVIGRVPLEKIYLIATPLHSQNFITEKDGLITNNRRIVTRNMWFNGTSLSEKARRALENEKVTIVSHISGHIHTIYKDATINRKSYELFSARLREFLITALNKHVFINFLRFKSKYKTLFQFECDCSGTKRYISLEKMFEYEHTSKYSVNFETRHNLVQEIEGDEFHLSPLQGKLMLNDVEEIIDSNIGKSLQEIENLVLSIVKHISKETIRKMFSDLSMFLSTDPKIPDDRKNFTEIPLLEISTDDTREKIIKTIFNNSSESELALLTIYTYRQMDRIDWLPFIKAAIERNPVCLNDLKGKSPEEVYKSLQGIPDISIYDDNRLALPDEIWNFKRGDGIEKAFLLADFILNNDKNETVEIDINKAGVTLTSENKHFEFRSGKSLRKHLQLSGSNYIVK
jgi:hypothetical protein